MYNDRNYRNPVVSGSYREGTNTRTTVFVDRLRNGARAPREGMTPRDYYRSEYGNSRSTNYKSPTAHK